MIKNELSEPTTKLMIFRELSNAPFGTPMFGNTPYIIVSAKDFDCLCPLCHSLVRKGENGERANFCTQCGSPLRPFSFIHKLLAKLSKLVNDLKKRSTLA